MTPKAIIEKIREYLPIVEKLPLASQMAILSYMQGSLDAIESMQHEGWKRPTTENEAGALERAEGAVRI